MKLRGSAENKIKKNENGQTLPHLEITEVALIHFDTVKHDSRVACSQQVVWLIVRFLRKKNHSFKNLFIQSFHLLKSGLLIKIVENQKKYYFSY